MTLNPILEFIQKSEVMENFKLQFFLLNKPLSRLGLET
jgi:hypothetical protein